MTRHSVKAGGGEKYYRLLKDGHFVGFCRMRNGKAEFNEYGGDSFGSEPIACDDMIRISVLPGSRDDYADALNNN